jgi:polysaccharide pyruvyl transferase WcaK-like protein
MVSWRAVRQLLATDVIAVGGGGIFGAGMPPLVRLLPFVLCFSRLVLGKRLVFQAIGAYSTTPQPSLGALRVAGRLADAVLVRDEASRETFRGGLAGRGVEPVLVGDPAIFLAPAEPEEAWETLRSAGVRSIPRPLVISLKPTPEAGLTALMVAALAGVAEWWCQHRFSDVVILPLSKTGDYGRGPAWGDAVLGRLLAEGLPDPSRIKILPPDLRPALAKAVVGEAEFVIAVRLHASIFAWSMGVPVLTLPFEEKAVTWLAQTGGAGIPLPHISAEAIVKFLESEKRS